MEVVRDSYMYIHGALDGIVYPVSDIVKIFSPFKLGQGMLQGTEHKSAASAQLYAERKHAQIRDTLMHT